MKFGAERNEFIIGGKNQNKSGRFGAERTIADQRFEPPVYHTHDGIDQPRIDPKFLLGYPIYTTVPTHKAEEGTSVIVNANYQINYNTLAGLFAVGEIIQDDQGNQATILSVSNINPGIIIVSNIGNTKIGNNGATTITGQTSGATATIVSVTGGFVYWYTMVNKVWNIMSISQSFNPTNDLTVNSITIGGGTPVTSIITNTASLNFGAIAPNTAANLTIPLTGAVVGDSVMIGVDDIVISTGVNCADITFFAWVSAPNVITIRCANISAVNTANPALGLFRVTIITF